MVEGQAVADWHAILPEPQVSPPGEYDTAAEMAAWAADSAAAWAACSRKYIQPTSTVRPRTPNIKGMASVYISNTEPRWLFLDNFVIFFLQKRITCVEAAGRVNVPIIFAPVFDPARTSLWQT